VDGLQLFLPDPASDAAETNAASGLLPPAVIPWVNVAGEPIANGARRQRGDSAAIQIPGCLLSGKFVHHNLGWTRRARWLSCHWLPASLMCSSKTFLQGIGFKAKPAALNLEVRR
jgi:hypothetical protein